MHSVIIVSLVGAAAVCGMMGLRRLRLIADRNDGGGALMDVYDIESSE